MTAGRDAPVGVLGTGSAALAVGARLQRLLPAEDVVAMLDHAYAPYGRLTPALVRRRAAALSRELAAWPVKCIVVASAAMSWLADDAVAAATRLPVVPMPRSLAPVAGHRPGLRVAVTGTDCVGPRALVARARRSHGGPIALDRWPALTVLVESGRAGSAEADRVAAAHVEALVERDAAAVLLACPHAAAIRTAVEQAAAGRLAVVDGAALVAGRTRQVLLASGLLALRRRPGRTVVLSSRPASAGGLAGTAGGLAGRYGGRRPAGGA